MAVQSYRFDGPIDTVRDAYITLIQDPNAPPGTYVAVGGTVSLTDEQYLQLSRHLILTPLAAPPAQPNPPAAATYVSATQPPSPLPNSLWIPLDAAGAPLPPDQWQVFT